MLSLDLKSGRVKEFLRSDGREFQTEVARKFKERTPSILVLLFRVRKTPSYVLGLCMASHAINASCVIVYIHRESKNCKLAERQWKHGMQNWRSCTVSKLVFYAQSADTVISGRSCTVVDIR